MATSLADAIRLGEFRMSQMMACCYFLVGSGWPLIFPGRLWMVAVISWWALDGY
jgi:hypothetical protein